MPRLEDLAPELFVSGIEPSGAAKIVYILRVGADSFGIIFERLNGQVPRRVGRGGK